jgi:hypothetical protein
VFDFSKLQNWLAQRVATHGECCNRNYFEALAQQLDYLLLVDVIAGNLIKLPASTRFVALSYVWGNVVTLKSSRRNVDEMMQRGALFREPFMSALPDTIRDAMHVVKVSSKHYLWVDCLCIIQDSGKEDIGRILQAMARIYAKAEFTIVAAQGEDADFGIRGVGGRSHEREPTFSALDYEHEGGNEFPWRSRWAARGWTFQEALFSRRLLVLSKEVSWICGRIMRLEHEEKSTFDLASAPIVWPSERPHLGVLWVWCLSYPRLPHLAAGE